jgi:hypothetical protein
LPAGSRDEEIHALARALGVEGRRLSDELRSGQDPSSIDRLAPLIGERTIVVHGPDMDEGDAGLSGGDIDCIVHRIDPMWPLRLPDGWRICQSLRYDLRGWYWVLERDGDVLAFDTIDDPWGLGRDAIRTDAFLAATAGAPASAVRAAYLTIKRVRKQNVASEEWARIGKLASEDPDAFRKVLAAETGDAISELLVPAAIAGLAPHPDILRRANDRRYFRRFGSPGRALRALSLGGQRYVQRIGQPAGLMITVVGPDGSGKSTLAQGLPELLERAFKRFVATHWRPGFLPAPGRILGTPPGDPTQPHARPMHGRVLSVALLGYYWADFMLGWLRDQPTRVRSGLVVSERGWWDMVVDPRRYRLDVPAPLVRALGKTLKRPDIAIILDAPPEVLLARKTELGREELSRQSAAWRTAFPPRVREMHVDATRPVEDVARDVRQRVLTHLEDRTVARLGAGWASLPHGRTRWWLPRGPRRVAVAGLSVYQPITPRARFGWEAARAVAAAGGFRALPRGSAPPRSVRTAVAEFLPPRGSVAVARCNHPHRYVAAMLSHRGQPTALVKVATDPVSIAALEREADAIERLGELLPDPLFAPRILARREGALALEFIEHEPREEPWRLDDRVALGMGAFFRTGAVANGNGGLVGPGHGDLAPWNLVRSADGWGLLDWESATPSAAPFSDIAHFLVQGHVLLGRPTWDELLSGFVRGRGWVGNVVNAFAEGACLPREEAVQGLRAYLARVDSAERPTTLDERRALRKRETLRAQLRLLQA